MSRPCKCRLVSVLPDNYIFTPTESMNNNFVTLSLDEFETINLLDYQGLDQEECAKRMEISRSSVQAIYMSARKKLSIAIVEARKLIISGGNIITLDQTEKYKLNTKGDSTMRIAVTYEDGQIFQHFGHTENFKVYDVENNKVTDSKVINTNGTGHGALATLLNGLDVDVLICGGIGGGAQMALAEAGIKLYGGVFGDADSAVDALLKGELEYNPNVMCSHHHHEEGHSCGSHSCVINLMGPFLGSFLMLK